MTKFEDQLFSDLMRDHGVALQSARRPSAARRRLPRPVWLASGAVSAAGAITAGALALGGAPAYAAYSVTEHPGGTVTVSVRDAAGVNGANAKLHRIHARVVVVPVRPGCPSIFSLPRPAPGRSSHLSVKVSRRLGGRGSVTVRVWGKGGIPQGSTMLLAFSGPLPGSHVAAGPALGAGVMITGRVPACVSLPSPPPGGSVSTRGSTGGSLQTAHGTGRTTSRQGG
jgi:hypothetical protein